MVLKRVLITLMVCLSFARVFEASRERTLKPARFPAALNPEIPSDPIAFFGLEQVAFIRDWFSEQAKLGTLPLELVRHETPPPLRRDEILPAELRQRVQPLPPALEGELPVLSGNLRRVIVLGAVVLLEEDTSRIVDLIPDAL